MPTAWCALSQNPLSLNNRVCPHAHSTTSPSTMRVLRDGPHGHTDAGQGQLLPTCPLRRSSLVGLVLRAPHSPTSARRPVFLPRLPSQTPQKEEVTGVHGIKCSSSQANASPCRHDGGSECRALPLSVTGRGCRSPLPRACDSGHRAASRPDPAQTLSRAVLTAPPQNGGGEIKQTNEQTNWHVSHTVSGFYFLQFRKTEITSTGI